MIVTKHPNFTGGAVMPSIDARYRHDPWLNHKFATSIAKRRIYLETQLFLLHRHQRFDHSL
jgi:hypothetical protein